VFPVAQPMGAQGTRAPSEILEIFCNESLEFQVSSIGAVQDAGRRALLVGYSSGVLITQQQRQMHAWSICSGIVYTSAEAASKQGNSSGGN